MRGLTPPRAAVYAGPAAMNETNRLLITLAAAAWIVLMAVIIFLAWSAPEDAIDRLGDFVEFLNDNNTDAGKAAISLAAAASAILALLLIIMEIAPSEEPKELRVEQAGATTIVPADALRRRLEEALLALPEVTVARAHVRTGKQGIVAALDLTVTPTAQLANVTQEASRVVIDTVQTDLGLLVDGVPSVRFEFGGTKAVPPPGAHAVTPRPDAPPMNAVETVDERVSGYPPPAASGHADSSPGPLIYTEQAPKPEEPREGSY